MKTINWISALKTTLNEDTSVIRYYIRKCDVYTRVSKEDYNNRSDDGVSDTFLTTIKGNLVHQYKTVRGTHITR